MNQSETNRTIATGTVTVTATGLIHRANPDRFITEMVDPNQTQMTKKNGRPFKDAHDLKLDFTPFLTPIIMTAPVGRVIRFQ